MFATEFNKKYGCDPRKSAKPRLRMLDTIEKCRKLLTLNKEADVTCESLMEDEDFRKNFKREELEELIQPFLDRFRKHMEDALAKSQLAPEMIDAVELVGDATRTPCIVEIIKDVMKKDTLNRTLNSTETIARGCALSAAMLSPNFGVSQFEVEEYNEHPICIQYQFTGAEKVTEKELFKVGSTFPLTKTITFENKLGGANLLIKYLDDATTLKGLPIQISQHQIPEGKKAEDKPIEKTSFIMRVTNNIHNIAYLDDAELAQEWTEEEKIPIKAMPPPAPKKEGEEAKEGEAPAPTVEAPPAEPQFEIKKKNKKTFSKLNFKTSNFALAPQQRKLFTEAEDKMMEADNTILNTKAVKNQLETYCYDMREKCDAYGSLEKNIDPAIKDQFLAEISKTVDWLYEEEGENAPMAEYQSKLEAFQVTGEPIKTRAFYWSELDAFLKLLDPVVDNIQKHLANPDFAHLTDEQR